MRGGEAGLNASNLTGTQPAASATKGKETASRLISGEQAPGRTSLECQLSGRISLRELLGRLALSRIRERIPC